MPTALVTGASSGLGLALTTALADRGWQVTVDARDARRLQVAVAQLAGVRPVPGDVTDSAHRAELCEGDAQLDLLVLNASELGPSPLPQLADYGLPELRRVLEVNVVASVALLQLLLPRLRRAPDPVVLALSSDAATTAYPGWGGYGLSKTALDHAMAVLAVEQPDVRVYAVDPGDMRTDMHQRAFPCEDIGDRPEPRTVVPALLELLDHRLPSGRYVAADLPVPL